MGTLIGSIVGHTGELVCDNAPSLVGLSIILHLVGSSNFLGLCHVDIRQLAVLVGGNLVGIIDIFVKGCYSTVNIAFLGIYVRKNLVYLNLHSLVIGIQDDSLVELIDGFVIILVTTISHTEVQVVIARQLNLIRSQKSIAGSNGLRETVQLGKVKEGQTVQTGIVGKAGTACLSYLKALLIIGEQIAVGRISRELIVFHLAVIHLIIIAYSLLDISCLVIYFSRNDVHGIVWTHLAKFLELGHGSSRIGLAVNLGIAAIAIYILRIHDGGLLKPSRSLTSIVLKCINVAHQHIAWAILRINLDGSLRKQLGIGGILNIQIGTTKGGQSLRVFLVSLTEILNLTLNGGSITLVVLYQLSNFLDVALHILCHHGSTENYYQSSDK